MFYIHQNSIKHFASVLGFIVVVFACKKKEGCTDPQATNYDTQAETPCQNCCVYNTPLDTTTIDTTQIINLKDTRKSLLISKDKWYWRTSQLLTYNCNTDTLSDSTFSNYNNQESYIKYDTANTGFFKNVSVTNTYAFWDLTENGETLMIAYEQQPSDTIFYTIDLLNDSCLTITANSEWCAQFGSYYFQTEGLKTFLN